ncbi:MAG: hypothetical protein FWG77_10470, partial [Treponema sp.]|nr:hypothetical protein [Treponema sp.]
MAKAYVCIVRPVLVILAFFLLLLLSCDRQQPYSPEQGESAAFTSLREIPGITEEEIRAVEALRTQYDYFTYGMILTTEAFIHDNGMIGGFAPLFC